MTLREALQAIRAAGNSAAILYAEDELTDDCIVLGGNPDTCIQVSATRDGLQFSATYATEEDGEFVSYDGPMTFDPVLAVGHLRGIVAQYGKAT